MEKQRRKTSGERKGKKRHLNGEVKVREAVNKRRRERQSMLAMV